jgi:predicted nucleic acid-binding Zn ribbon protein
MMPTYDYECDSCHHRYELYQSITAKPTKKQLRDQRKVPELPSSNVAAFRPSSKNVISVVSSWAVGGRR